MKTLIALILMAICLNSFIVNANDDIERIDKNIGIKQLSDNAYLIQSSFSGNGILDCNHMLIIDAKDIVLVNTPVSDSMTAIMLNLIEKRFGRPVTKVVISHFHEDSSGGIQELSKRGIISYSLDKTRDLLPLTGKMINVIFKDSLAIPLQTINIKLFYFGPGHSVDGIVTWFPENKILFGGCSLKSLSSAGKGNTKDANMTEWPITVTKIKNRFSDAQIVIPGHMSIGDVTVLDHTIKVVSQ